LLEDALLKLLNDNELAIEIGEAGRVRALSRYEVNIAAKEIVYFYQNSVSVQ
jgi:hypothetical protein